MSGGLISLILLGVEEDLKAKRKLDLNKLHYSTYVMNSSGLGVIDEYVEYFIAELEKIDIYLIHDIDNCGNTLLHDLCLFSYKVRHKFSERLFNYLLSKGVDINIRNNKGKTCIDYLLNWCMNEDITMPYFFSFFFFRQPFRQYSFDLLTVLDMPA